MTKTLAAWTPTPMRATFGLFLVLPAILPWIGGYTYLGTEVMIWGLFALGYNLLLGYTGLPAFGHGAFFGMAGYFLAASQKWWTGGLWLPLLIGILGTAACGAVVALLVARRRGIYFSLLTIAFGVMFWFLVFVLDTWTGGEDGLTGLQRFSAAGVDLRGNLAFYYFVYPNVMLNIMPGRLQVNRILPLGPDRCRVEFDYYYAADAAARSRMARDREFSEEIQQEDIAICERKR